MAEDIGIVDVIIGVIGVFLLIIDVVVGDGDGDDVFGSARAARRRRRLRQIFAAS